MPHDTELFRVLQRLILRYNSDIVRIDSDNRLIYHSEIRCGRNPRGEAEELVRACCLVLLHHESGYSPGALAIEYPVRARVGRGGSDKYADIAVVQIVNGRENVYGLIECKIHGETPASNYVKDRLKAFEQQLFGLQKFVNPPPAVLCLAETQANPVSLASDEDWSQNYIPNLFEIIDAKVTHTFDDWQENGHPTLRQPFPSNFGRPIKRKWQSGTEHDLHVSITSNELQQLAKRLHNDLWGGGGAQSTDIFPLITRLLLAKIQDERTCPSNKPYDFQVFSGEGINETLGRLDVLYQSSVAGRLRVHDQDAARLRVREPDICTDAQIRHAIEQLEVYNFSALARSPETADPLGKFFETIMNAGFKQGEGQFFTHANIVEAMLDAVGVAEFTEQCIRGGKPPPTIIDPAAGSGTFLIHAMLLMGKILRTLHGSLYELSVAGQDCLHRLLGQQHLVNQWAESFLFGCENNADLGLAAQVNMMLHADGSSSVYAGPSVGNGLNSFAEYPHNQAKLTACCSIDGYSCKVNENFDFVVTNPPFGMRYNEDEMDRYRRNFELAHRTNKSEELFIERWFQLLKPGGRLAAILPRSILDGRKSEGRKFLQERFQLRAIVTLPDEAFKPHTPARTAIVLAYKPNKQSPRSFDSVYMAEADTVGYYRNKRGEHKSNRNALADIARELKEAEIWVS